VFDVGIQTSRALSRIRAGHPPYLSGPSSERENGNGSLMRVLPVALLHDPTDEGSFGLIDKAMRQSLPTHGHPRSQLCCAQLVLWAQGLRQKLDQDAAWNLAATELMRFASGADGARDYSSFTSQLSAECQLVLADASDQRPRGSGYVLDSLRSARWAMRGRTYESVVKRAVQLGDDTDTTAAIAGGLAGIRDGLRAIPERWILSLRDREIAERLISRAL
jgi:ADP-ribosylglycohydrolase